MGVSVLLTQVMAVTEREGSGICNHGSKDTLTAYYMKERNGDGVMKVKI